MNENILICIFNYRHDDNARRWHNLLSPYFECVVLDSGNDKKCEDFIQFPNIYYSGLFNEMKKLSEKKEYKWVGIITSDVTIDNDNSEKLIKKIGWLQTTKNIGIYSILGSQNGHSNRFQYATIGDKSFRYIEGFFQIVRKEILEKQEYINTSINLYGYGVDYTSCFISNKLGYINFVDESINIFHPKEKGYNKEKAISQQKRYYQYIKENYFNDYIIKVKEFTKRQNNIDGEEKIKYMRKEGISIIIAAYNTANYIEDTIKSIYEQNYIKNNDNFEVLIGVDGCVSTLNKVKSFFQNYKNLRVFSMDSNMGTYVTSNTLIKISQYNKILRFDSDDLMCEGFLSKIMEESKTNDVVRFAYYDYENENKKKMNVLACGAALFDISVFNKAGGYKNWKCSADYELVTRIKNHFSVKGIYEPLFLHRIRQDSLMHQSDTSMKSEYRKKVNATVREYSLSENIYIEPVCNTYSEIFSSKHNSIKTLLCAIGKFENKYIKEWVEHYHNLGISNIWLYDNNDINGEHFESILKDYIKSGFVTIIDYRGKKVCQLLAYQDCYKKNSNLYDWICFFDCDEYLTIPNGNINTLLTDKRYDNFNAIHVNWMCYGDGNLLSIKGNTLLNSITEPLPLNTSACGGGRIDNSHAKSIIRGGISDIKWGNPHTPSTSTLKHCDTHGNGMPNNWYVKEPTYDIAYLKHYTTKSTEDFALKLYRGFPDQNITDTAIKRLINEYFERNTRTPEKENILNNYKSFIKNKQMFHGNEILKRICEPAEGEFTQYFSKEERTIVTMTSWKKRIANVPTVLKTILENTELPDLIVINLATEEFPNKEQDLPQELNNLVKEKNGLIEINWLKNNTKVWKKIFPTLFKYPNDCTINIDDDFLYPNDFIKTFKDKHKEISNKQLAGVGIKLWKSHGQHCGCASLDKLEWFGDFVYNINQRCLDTMGDDDFYTYCLYANNVETLFVGKKFFTNMKSFNSIESFTKSNGQTSRTKITETLNSLPLTNNKPVEKVIESKPAETKKESVIDQPIIDSMNIGTPIKKFTPKPQPSVAIRPSIERNPKIRSRALRILMG